MLFIGIAFGILTYATFDLISKEIERKWAKWIK